MATAGRSETRLRRAVQLAVSLALASGGLVLMAAPASAVSCPFDANTRTASMVLSASDVTATISAQGGYLMVDTNIDSVGCALLNQVNTVTINTSARPDIQLYFSLDLGPLGPGYLDEGNGSSEIEFSITGMGSASLLGITGSDAADGITLGQWTDKIAGVTYGQINLNALADGATPDVDVSFSSFPGLISVYGAGGDDTIRGSGTGSALTGPIWTPLSLNGAEGANTLTGGSGDDTLIFREQAAAGEGGDALSGGAGVDTVRASTVGTPAVATITLDGIANDGSNCPGTGCNGDNVGLDVERVIGSVSSETIKGNSAGQYLAGGTGGDDALYGGGGADELHATTGVAQGGAGNDVLVPESADCVLRGGKGRDTASFAAVPKSVVVSLDNVANDGPAGSTINVRTDIEKVVGTDLSDTLIGSDSANTLVGGAGDDALYGLGGADVLMPGQGTDSVAGGPGRDQLSYAASQAPIVVNAVARTVTGEGTDTYSSIESYLGSAFADGMDGSDAGERFAGGPGNDVLNGFGGADTLLGGPGDDTIDGGSGTDTCSQGAGTGTITNCEV